MSRSYKHTPRCGERKGKYSKRLANHVVRAQKFRDSFPRYSGYKKLFESWNICDYEWVGESFERFYASEIKWSARDRKPPPNPSEARNRYEKLFIRK